MLFAEEVQYSRIQCDDDEMYYGFKTSNSHNGYKYEHMPIMAMNYKYNNDDNDVCDYDQDDYKHDYDDNTNKDEDDEHGKDSKTVFQVLTNDLRVGWTLPKAK